MEQMFFATTHELQIVPANQCEESIHNRQTPSEILSSPPLKATREWWIPRGRRALVYQLETAEQRARLAPEALFSRWESHNKTLFRYRLSISDLWESNSFDFL